MKNKHKMREIHVDIIIHGYKCYTSFTRETKSIHQHGAHGWDEPKWVGRYYISYNSIYTLTKIKSCDLTKKKQNKTMRASMYDIYLLLP